jgi:hypothetical protein
MSNDSFTETTSTGWFSRIGSSIKGVLFGAVLLLIAAVLLWWNEGRSVKTAKGLAEGAQIAVEADAGSIDAAKEGKLVHVAGTTTVKEPAADPLFGVTAPDLLKLKRRVELFQWTEEKKETTKQKVGGGEETVTEYRYSKQWSDKVYDSSDFHRPQGHENPKPSVEHAEFLAPDARLGAFRLPEFLLAQWNDFRPQDLPSMSTLPDAFRSQATLQDKWLVLSATPKEPQVGDARVQFESIKAGDASLLARQVKDTFESFATSYGTSIARITSGIQSKDAMFAAAQAENTFMAWLLRVVGFVMMFVGFGALFRPLRVLADVLPIAGRIVGAGTGFVAFILAATGSVIIIAMAWLWYRPLLGITLLVLAGGGVFLLNKSLRNKGTAA